jgi:hypothetical protein
VLSFIEHHAMKAYWGSRITAPRILSPQHYMEVSGQIQALAVYAQGQSPWYPTDRRLGWPQSRSGRGSEENFQPLPRIELPIVQPVAQGYTTELSQL